MPTRSRIYSLFEKLPVTPESTFLDRRRFLKSTTLSLGAGSMGLLAACDRSAAAPPTGDPTFAATLKPHAKNGFKKGTPNPRYTADRPLTPETIAGSYNNFYEFTTDKDRVWRLARQFKTHPWTLEITGLVQKPRTIDLAQLIAKTPAQQRIYRLRCVEAWAMTVPWTGFPLKTLIDLAQPKSSARFVRFESFLRPAQATGQRPPTSWHWPYYEGITMAEATNDLAFLATGIYGHALPNQHGAPIRVVLPWKYGYKSIKSIVKLEFLAERPKTFWNDVAPNEYDFWSNVNPKKPHPRWSQATERLIGSGKRVPTRPYNGYGEFVHQLYKGTPQAAI